MNFTAPRSKVSHKQKARPVNHLVCRKALHTFTVVLMVLVGASTVNAQFQGGDSGAGYIDSAIVRNQVRFRADASYDSPTPYRAEFLYPKCRCPINGVVDPAAPGPPLAETSIDYQELSGYIETMLFSDLISGFVEIPFRLIDPEINENAQGFSDINLGFRAALLRDNSRHLTFQLRTTVPTGDGAQGLGIEHVRLEPGVLFLKRCKDGTIVEGEIRDSISIGGTAWAGNVLRYGIGFSRLWYRDANLTISPVWETVAWSVLGGRVSKNVGTAAEFVEDAETTIVNTKIGARFRIASNNCSGENRSLYVGYGTSLTGARWYSDTLRAEYRISF